MPILPLASGVILTSLYSPFLYKPRTISVSGYFERYEKYAPFSVRTVRNLGLITPAYSTEGVEGVGYPVPLVNVSENGKGGYLFDLTNVNEKSLRYYTSRELEHGDENAESSRVYYGFETGPTVTRTAVNGNNNLGNYQSLIGALEAGTETGCDTIDRTSDISHLAVQELTALYDCCFRLLAENKLLALCDYLIDLFDGQMFIGNSMCHFIVCEIPGQAGDDLCQYVSNQIFICDVRECDLQARSALHFTPDGVHRALVAGPATACDTVVHIPKEHVLDMAV